MLNHRIRGLLFHYKNIVIIILGGASIFLAAYKSGTETRGRGHWDACVGTWDWGRVTRDLGTSSMGRGDVWDGDAGR